MTGWALRACRATGQFKWPWKRPFGSRTSKLVPPRMSAGVVAILCLLANPVGGTAQYQPRLDFGISSGYLLPTSDFGRGVRLADGNFASFGRIAPLPTFGGFLRLTSDRSPWAIRARVLHTLPSDVLATWDCVGGCPDILIRWRSEATVTTAVLSLIHFLPQAWGERPRFFAAVGAGAKRYTFEWTADLNSATADLRPATGDLIDFAIHFGMGAEWTWRSVDVHLEAADYASWTGAPDDGNGPLERPGDPASSNRPAKDSRFLHDILISASAAIRFF